MAAGLVLTGRPQAFTEQDTGRDGMERRLQIATVAGLAGLALLAWLPWLDRVAVEHVEDGFRRALIAHATARALNAGISLLQESTVAVSVLGTGVTVALGQVLDPLNDLVEWFASMMLLATVSFGVQRVLVAIGGYWLLALALTAVAGWAAFVVLKGGAWPRGLRTALIILLLARFAVPASAIASEGLYRAFMAADLGRSQQMLERLASSASEQGATQPGWRESLSPAEWKRRLEFWVQASEQAVDSMVRVIVVFLLQTLMLPLAILWALVRLAGLLARGGPQPA